MLTTVTATEAVSARAAGWRPRLVASRPSVSVVIPTLNEAPSLQWVLDKLPSWVSQVVLVDGLSTDLTELIARGVRHDVIVIHQPRPGKGAAVRAGFAAATGDIIVMLDADASTHPAEMERFIDALVDGAEFVKGSRHLSDGGSDDFSALRRAGNRGFVSLVNFIYGCRFTDLCYGYCAFWRRDLDALGLTADGFEIETQLVLRAVRAGLEIREVPSFELPRQHGKSNLNAFADGKRVLKTILDERPGQAAPAPAAGQEIEAGRRRAAGARIARLDAGRAGPPPARTTKRELCGRQLHRA